MIILVHQHHTITQVLDAQQQPITAGFVIGETITKTLQKIAQSRTDALIIWCEQQYLEFLNVDDLSKIFHHQRVLASYNLTQTHYLPKHIGYVERSYFLKVNKSVTFPTWLMSSQVGGVHASVLTHLKEDLNFLEPFDYFLNSLAKRAMVEGLFCYSEPSLLLPNTSAKTETKHASTCTLFKFVKQHYKWVWVFFLSACYLIYDRKFTFFPLLKSLFYKQLSTHFNLDQISIQSTKQVIKNKDIDVIIPTIGRKHYLYDVLKDLSVQTILPKNVIIVEQNPLEDSVSELDYLKTHDWPFNIKHTFTHQSGVCNARNLALSQVESEWTFLGDDDNRFEAHLIETLFNHIKQYGVQVGTTVYLQPNETQTYLKTAQTSIFGAGNSIIKSSLIKQVKFNMNFEFNYGEDNDFGMQLRHLGEDVVYFADIKITHLKAPIGGYRTKVKQLWADDVVQPKPSPTIMLLNETYFTKHQLLGYKLLLGLRSFKHSPTKNPFAYIKQYKKQWKRSQFWSTTLQSKTHA
ncbi:glycosyltransferase family 2 protein [Olleya aquimaris]|uniref:GT2 family glycosyltransferase n=1 Tax=Olleya aquimaris TaxID=639310 RepID=A0A327RLF5_9FLAO|nr:glycosyltransferase family A protein [Olleya aquimaris]RAJ16998.1 GT2 family glycosyltransferase [Olleya aquimaris]